jgi:hypothetical protein
VVVCDRRWRRVARAAALTSSIACGPETGAPAAGSSSGAEATTATATSGIASTSDGPASTSSAADGTTSSTSSTAAETSAGDTGIPSCGALEVDECEAAGCVVFSGVAFRYDASVGVCIEEGPLDVCASGPAQQTPTDFWGIDDRGEVIVLQLLSSPSGLGPWSGCGCRPGDPFACWGCSGEPGCSGQGMCSGVMTADECTTFPGGGCQWVEAFVVTGDGAGCAAAEPFGRCVDAVPAKADCRLATPPVACGDWSEPAPPYVRPVDGGIEVITGVPCDVFPWGYMPCWSAPAGDPPACECAC